MPTSSTFPKIEYVIFDMDGLLSTSQCFESSTDDDDDEEEEDGGGGGGGRLMNGHFFLSLSFSFCFWLLFAFCFFFFPIALPPSGGFPDEYSVSLLETLS
jgi:hypothetical protein